MPLRILRILRPVPVPVPVPRPALRAAMTAAAVRPFSSSTTRYHGERFGESKSDDPDFEVEKLKDESLEKQKKGKGEWKPELASDSEEAIQADKSGFDIGKIKKEKGIK